MGSTALTCWYSTRTALPKYHLDPVCTGLDRVGPTWRGETQFASPLALTRDRAGRPCRHCALEAALGATWVAPWTHVGRTMLVTISGQGNPAEPSVGWETYVWSAVSETGAARLARLASLFGLRVDETCVGPVATGWVSARFAKLLERNLRCYELAGDRSGSLHPLQLQVFWSLMTRDAGDRLGPADAWTLAAASVA